MPKLGPFSSTKGAEDWDKDTSMLYMHWLVAKSIRDSIDYNVDFDFAMNNVKEYSKMHTNAERIKVWYALLFVVVEGYQELKLRDERIDKLLNKEDYVALLKRFRNSIFHFQKNWITEKMIDFLQKDNSKEWIDNLDKAFDEYFGNSFPMDKPLEELKKAGFIKAVDNETGTVYF